MGDAAGFWQFVQIKQTERVQEYIATDKPEREVFPLLQIETSAPALAIGKGFVVTVTESFALHPKAPVISKT